MGYGGCKQRIKDIDKCKERFCRILRIIKIIKKGVSVGAGGGGRFDPNHLKMEKKTEKNDKK